VKPPPVPQDRPVRVYVADANVLYSHSLRDYLLYAMRARLIAVRWSRSITAEVVEHLIENRDGFTAESGERLVRAMNVTFPGAQIDPGLGDFAALAGFDLPDENDRRVIAAALAGEAEFICTHDVGDQTRFDPIRIRIESSRVRDARSGIPRFLGGSLVLLTGVYLGPVARWPGGPA
jgi:predicted nucleic acid-binding protein